MTVPTLPRATGRSRTVRRSVPAVALMATLAVALAAGAQAAAVPVPLGTAESFDDVSEFMRGLNNIAWCPKGMGRVVERMRNGSFKIELLSGDAEILEIAPQDLGFFFSNIELKSTTTEAALTKSGIKPVKFDMSLSVNLGI